METTWKNMEKINLQIYINIDFIYLNLFIYDGKNIEHNIYASFLLLYLQTNWLQ